MDYDEILRTQIKVCKNCLRPHNRLSSCPICSHGKRKKIKIKKESFKNPIKKLKHLSNRKIADKLSIPIKQVQHIIKVV